MTTQILVVEGESVVAKDIQAELVGLGYVVSEATQKAAETQPDLVLTDAAPHKRGLEGQLEENARQLAALSLELQARNEELDAFAHTVAHSLSNPLEIIAGYAEVLETNYESLPDAERRKYLRKIRRSGRKINNIVKELFLLAEVRKQVVQTGPLDMASIVAEAQQSLVDMIEERRAEVVLPAGSAWPVALGYAPWVEEIWINYISNAIKYGGQPPRVELGADLLPYPAGEGRGRAGVVRFWVRDNGPGIAPEDQAKLFVPFTRLDQARAKGHGLGLSIVLRIVEKLGGQVGVESKVGRGSVFSFTLPAP